MQIDGAIAGQGGDAGLGLPIARKLAELMGGVIGCESVVGQGSLYWFTLPAEQARAGAPAATQVKEGGRKAGFRAMSSWSRTMP